MSDLENLMQDPPLYALASWLSHQHQVPAAVETLLQNMSQTACPQLLTLSFLKSHMPRDKLWDFVNFRTGFHFRQVGHVLSTKIVEILSLQFSIRKNGERLHLTLVWKLWCWDCFISSSTWRSGCQSRIEAIINQQCLHLVWNRISCL